MSRAQEHHLRVARTARYYTIGNAAADELWIVCHGYAQLARYFIRSFAPIDDGSRLIVAPEALNRYYFESAPGVHAHDARVAATWMTREDRLHEIDDYVAYLDLLVRRLQRERRTIALGFSQGAATVSRWAARGSPRVDAVVLWGSGLPPELEPGPQLCRGARLIIAAGMHDPAIAPGRLAQEEARLREAGMPYELVRYPGGHGIDDTALRSIAATLRPHRHLPGQE